MMKIHTFWGPLNLYSFVITSILFLVIDHHVIQCQRNNYHSDPSTMQPCKANYPDPQDKTKINCVCTKEYCDNLVFEWPQPGQLLKIETNKLGKRFSLDYSSYKNECSDENDGADCVEDQPEQLPTKPQHEFTVTLDYRKQYQTIIGWGGAFTDASMININSLADNMSTILLENYYGSEGLRYNFGRVPIAGTDFSTHPYTYNDVEGPDYEQIYWTLANEDTELKIPYIKLAKRLTETWGGQLKLFASSWSPPKWMKTNKNIVRGHLIGPSTSDGKVYKAYAEYLLRFLLAYKESGLQMWGMTLQNEPALSYAPEYSFNSLEFSPREQVDFIKYHFGPLLMENGLDKSNLKLIIGDDSIGLVNLQVDQILKDDEVKQYISGLAIHWYLDGILPYSYMDKLYENHKNDTEFLIMSEACTGSGPLVKKVIPGDWSRGMHYATDIIEDLNRNVGGWVDWNLALDFQGGPNWAKNYVDSAILVDYVNNQFFKNPMYYALGHFTRFIPAGFVRIQSSIAISRDEEDHRYHLVDLIGAPSKLKKLPIKGTAFISPSKEHISLVLMNTSNEVKEVRVDILSGKEQNIEQTNTISGSNSVKLSPQSITTLVFGLQSEK